MLCWESKRCVFTLWNTQNAGFLTLISCIRRPENKPVSAEDADNLVWTELPDKHKYPELYYTVISGMMHAPCGEQNSRSPCMKNSRCLKTFPKHFRKRPQCRRISMSHTDVHAARAGSSATKMYNCHINVKICATNKAIKYIYTYVYKGSDKTIITIGGEKMQPNEIRQYILGRYISPIEACNRIVIHLIQRLTHSVVNLPIHQEDMNMVAYHGLVSTTLPYNNIIHRGGRSKLNEFLKLCTRCPDATESLLYKDAPTKYRWDNKK
ncbi:Helitron helicase [Phytophthora megakarya]|uniref:Helitron helicase n=1 Tax=Phytophthora megakarya TaxID=4795 RepID=A0A225VAJ6_9STRA|nr:Helitron helicase [Phytophthora megakarya]